MFTKLMKFAELVGFSVVGATIGHYEVGGEQMARAMNLAMEEAGMGPGDIDQIHVSANYSGELDHMEYEQLKKFFPKSPEELAVTPLKYLIGNFGGAGIIRAAAILLSLFRLNLILMAVQ